jgi:hypothetical protein
MPAQQPKHEGVRPKTGFPQNLVLDEPFKVAQAGIDKNRHAHSLVAVQSCFGTIEMTASVRLACMRPACAETALGHFSGNHVAEG